MEQSVRSVIGPQYGFDTQKIDRHYRYFRDLQKQYPVLQSGSFLPLHINPSSLKLFSYCRYDHDSLFIVIASFESEPHSISLSFDELFIPLSTICNESLFVIIIIVDSFPSNYWTVHYIREDKTCLV